MRAYILHTGNEDSDNILAWLSENEDIMEITVLKEAETFLEKVEREKPELVFIRLEGLGVSGLQIGRIIKEMDFESRIIFMSGDKDCAIDAYDVGAYGYLLCPLQRKKFDKIILNMKGVNKG